MPTWHRSALIRFQNAGPAVDFSILRFSFSRHGFVEQRALIYWQSVSQSLPLTLGEESVHLLFTQGIVMSYAVMREGAAIWARRPESPNDKVDILFFQVDFTDSFDHLANRNCFIAFRTASRVLQSRFSRYTSAHHFPVALFAFRST
jgi:hypothetical protein